MGHGISGDLERLSELRISRYYASYKTLITDALTELPSNVLTLDTATFERQLFNTGMRGQMLDHSGQLRQPGSTLSLGNLLRSLNMEIQCTLHNSGNDAYMALLAMQMLLDPSSIKSYPQPLRSKYPTGYFTNYGGAFSASRIKRCCFCSASWVLDSRRLAKLACRTASSRIVACMRRSSSYLTCQ